MAQSASDNSESEVVDLGSEHEALISSTAKLSSSVVIRRAQSLIPTFSKLRPNADLNCPPPNWLRSENLSSLPRRTPNMTFDPLQTTEGDEDTSERQVIPSSVMLASHYPKAVGHVDVISDSKNIKKLLKLPYSNSPVSLVVHRAGNKTLLIDDFSAPQLFNRAARFNLEKIIQDSTAPDPSRLLLPRKKDPGSTHQRNMMSKFLYYSTQEDSNVALVPASFHTVPVKSLTPSEHKEAMIKDNIESVQSFESTGGTSGEQTGSLCSSDGESASLNCTDMNSAAAVVLECVTNEGDVSTESIVSPESSLSEAKCHSSAVDETERVTNDLEPSSSLRVPSLAPLVLNSNPISKGPNVTIYNPQSIDSVSSVFRQPASTGHVPHASSITSGVMTEDGREKVFPSQPPCLTPQPFHLNMQWSVKDTSMLLGSDLPIFGVDGHPAISLRLRDMKKPITVLTGMDYWLDNLMCNVPELAMCFHIDGIVQDYHIIKTEDIPKFDESCKFQPEEVLDVVRNILGFLKANCTQEGHTYWLFRKKGEDVVKLYDLTSLNCFKGEGEASQNPFAMAVAVLFYRVAHNMLTGDEQLNNENMAVAKLLLENCIKLIGQKDKEVTVSAYYLLSVLFLEKVVDPSHSEVSGKDPIQLDGNGCTTKTMATATCTSLSVSLLREGCSELPVDKDNPLPPLVVGSSLDRARLALEQVSCAILSLSVNGTLLTPDLPVWKTQSVRKLLAQAGSAYYLLAEVSLDQSKLGRALRYGKYSVLCSRASSELQISVGSSMVEKGPSPEQTLSNAWKLCGDIHCLSTKMSESFSANLEDFLLEYPEDSTIITLAESIIKDMGEKEMGCLSLYTELETSLLKSIDCYQLAASLFKQLPSSMLLERQGNAWNELGVYYLQVAASLDFIKEPRNVEKLWKSSYSCISNGLILFQKTGNQANQALLSANLGKLMCSCAHSHGLQPSSDEEQSSISNDVSDKRNWEYSRQEKLYYSKSVEYYLQAKQALKHRSAHPVIWTNIIMDLSSVYLAIGTVMLTHPPLSYLTQQDISLEVSDVLNKALCQNVEPEIAHVDSHHPRFAELFRVGGDCHARLCELHHHNSLSTAYAVQKVKQLRTLTEKHYTKAVTMYKMGSHSCDLLKLQLEYAKYMEQHAKGKNRLKGLQSSFSCLLQAIETLQDAALQLKHDPPDSKLNTLCHSLVQQVVELLKQLLLAAKKRSENEMLIQIYKRMYAEVLQSVRLEQSNELNAKNLPCILETLLKLVQYNVQIYDPSK